MHLMWGKTPFRTAPFAHFRGHPFGHNFHYRKLLRHPLDTVTGLLCPAIPRLFQRNGMQDVPEEVRFFPSESALQYCLGRPCVAVVRVYEDRVTYGEFSCNSNAIVDCSFPDFLCHFFGFGGGAVKSGIRMQVYVVSTD